jgi:hypothetical protein
MTITTNNTFSLRGLTLPTTWLENMCPWHFKGFTIGFFYILHSEKIGENTRWRLYDIKIDQYYEITIITNNTFCLRSLTLSNTWLENMCPWHFKGFTIGFFYILHSEMIGENTWWRWYDIKIDQYYEITITTNNTFSLQGLTLPTTWLENMCPWHFKGFTIGFFTSYILSW